MTKKYEQSVKRHKNSKKEADFDIVRQLPAKSSLQMLHFRAFPEGSVEMEKAR